MKSKNLLLALSLMFITQSYALAAPGDCVLNDGTTTQPFLSKEGGCKDMKTNLVWSISGNDALHTLMSFSFAESYCANLVEGNTGAMCGDWRLPTVSELVALHADGGSFYVNASYMDVRHRWTSVKKGNKAYTVVIGTGATALESKYNYLDAICVRQGSLE